MVRMGSPVPIPVEGSTRTVLASARSTARPARFQPLLDGLELVGVVVTSDALQTPPRGRRVAGDHKAGPRPVQLQRQGQPAHTAGPLRRLPWQRVLMADRTRDRGHGRVELRTLKAVSVRHFGFPHAAQVLQVTRKTRDLHTNNWWAVTVYAITSLSFELARPARPADLLRGHWAIEALHHIRDGHLRQGRLAGPHRRGPGVMAALRNLAIGVLCRAGPVNLAAALRHARDPHRPLASLGISLG